MSRKKSVVLAATKADLQRVTKESTERLRALDGKIDDLTRIVTHQTALLDPALRSQEARIKKLFRNAVSDKQKVRSMRVLCIQKHVCSCQCARVCVSSSLVSEMTQQKL